MRKKTLFLFIAFAFIFVSTSSINAETTLTQADFDAALANSGVETNKITCDDIKCRLADNEQYILSGDITLPTGKPLRVNNNSTVLIVSHGSITAYMKRILNLKSEHLKKGKLEIFNDVDFENLFKHNNLLKDMANML